MIAHQPFIGSMRNLATCCLVICLVISCTKSKGIILSWIALQLIELIVWNIVI